MIGELHKIADLARQLDEAGGPEISAACNRAESLIARLRNRVETSFKEITDQMDLARHGAHTFEGLLTRTVATLAAHTLLLTQLTGST